MIEKLRDLGYRVGWAQGATPDEMKQQQREAGWAWEGDTHTHHDGELIQHDDPNAPGYVPEHQVLRDDSDQPTIWFVEGPVRPDASNEFGQPSGFVAHRGTHFETPMPATVRTYVRGDDHDVIQAFIDGHDAVVAELGRLERETPEETAERHQHEAEERAAERQEAS